MSILEDLADEVELAGYEPGTPQFGRALLARRVEKCKEMQGVGECHDCKAFYGCGLVKEYLIQIRYPGQQKNDRRNGQ